MYTPGDINRSDLITDDRPYAGWSYVGFAYHRLARFADRLDFLDSVEIQTGMVGPLSLAEETQTLVHELRGIGTAEGWDHQLENEPGLVVAFERKWLLSQETSFPLATNAIIHVGGALGNVSTYFNTGLEVRYGLNLPGNFGVSLIRPAGSTHFSPAKDLSIYLFAAVNGKYVLRDIFLDGDLAGGLTFAYKNLMLTYTHISRTREFVGQEKSHDFGSMTLSFFYPFW
jgi:hypothetical protein